jgi:hypothetical protein
MPELKSKTPLEEKILVGRHDAAGLLSVSVRTIDNLVAEKLLHARHIRGRVLFLRSELQALAERLK